MIVTAPRDGIASPRPLRCSRCRSLRIVVTGAPAWRQTGWEPRLQAKAQCEDCGNRWWSAAAEALRRSAPGEAGPVKGVEHDRAQS